jgi:hypothetical protein
MTPGDSSIHGAGISLELIVSKARASLKGKGASNTADYYDYRRGLYDGVASVAEALHRQAVGSTHAEPGSATARLDVFLTQAARELRKAEPAGAEDPHKIQHVAAALVALAGALEAALEAGR